MTEDNLMSRVESEMTLDEYQEMAYEFAEYGDYDYPWLALAEEVGELLALKSKAKRGDDLIKRYGSEAAYKQEIMSELGDVLWEVNAIAQDSGFRLEDVAKFNISKLRSRRRKGTIKGSDKHDRG